MAALRIERYEEFLLLRFLQPLLGALVHTAGIVVAGNIGLTIYRYHARVKTIPLAVVVGSHLTVIELPRLRSGIVVLTDTEVQHPAGIGPQLVVAGVEGVAEHKLSAGMAFGGDDDVLALHEQTVRREQLDIEDAAHVGRRQVVSTDYVCLKPQGVADEVALVIGVYVDFLLNLGNGRLLQRLADIVKRAGLNKLCHRQQHCQQR